MRRASPDMQDASGAGEGMESSVFLCVAATSRGRNKLSYFRSNVAGEEEVEAARALSALCLDHAPEHHHWHHHTVDGRRTFAFLAGEEDGRTYLAIAEPTPGGTEVVRFLERVRDACGAAPRRRRLRDEAVSRVVRQFVQTLQPGPISSSTANAVLAGAGGSFSDEASSADEEALPEEGGSRRRQRPTRPSWMHTWWRRHAMAVIGVDVVLCLVLFGVWLAVCHGFTCVQR
uniref:Uncharacterized protein n=1 Tax=Avena sativa TaxID=4498 RepID=A0ACD5WJ51_AVESA